MNEKQLRSLYEKYIDIPLYRVVPVSDYKKIKINGINPDNDPYEKIKPLVIKLARIVERIKKEHGNFYIKWTCDVSASYALNVTLTDLSIKRVDFAPDQASVPYYLALKGGAATANIKKIITKLREFRLSSSEKAILEKINQWINNRICNNIAFYVQGNSKSFESAFFQPRRKRKTKVRRKFKKPTHWPSPFGSFKHFKKIASKYGIRKYMNYLKDKEFFLRVREKIPKEEIHLL